MSQPSAEWVAEQQQAEQRLVSRYANLTEVLIRADGYIAYAEARAEAVAREPHGNPEACRQEAADLRRLVLIAEFHLANLGRIHLIEVPPRRERSSFGGPRR